tara:strand:+ start:230 stop:973 length:744 start_codon:yes stop_codon:yes gene_type:complete
MFDDNYRSFRGDLELIIDKVKKKERFAFSKYADGELHILTNKPINNGEFWFVPNENQFHRDQMIKSFQFKDDNYFVGICCPCCGSWGVMHPWMKQQSKQQNKNLTFANVFVNGNHEHYIENMVPLYSNYDVILVSNSNSNLEKLPFKVSKHFQIGKNAWVDDTQVIEKIKEYISKENIKDSLFLFCAGPFGNILAHQLFEYNKENTYIDIGSTLNHFLLGEKGKNRGYLRGEKSLQKKCTWEIGNEH